MGACSQPRRHRLQHGALVGGRRDAQCAAHQPPLHGAQEAKQQFNQTIVEEDDEAAAALSTSAGVGPSNSAAAAGTSNAAVQEI